MQPCKNNGNCSDDGVKCFKCDCPDGFKGFDCSKKGNSSIPFFNEYYIMITMKYIILSGIYL